jgi:MYXO-CTERM domain-containing protein
MWSEKDFDGALRIFKPACDGGVAVACNFVGFANYTGKGTRWDVRKAVSYYEKACTLEIASACANLGEMTEHGIGVEKNLERARQLFELGCTPSDVVGCGSLGRFYEKGLGGGANEVRTGKASASDVAALLQKAYDLAKAQAPDNPYGKYVLGTFVRDGVSVVSDKVAAAKLFEEGCDGYDPLACWKGGLLNADNPSKLAVARVQLGRACAAGITDACTKVEELEKASRADKPPPPHKPPPVQHKGAAGCACDIAPTRSQFGGGLFLILVVLAAGRRRRTSVLK